MQVRIYIHTYMHVFMYVAISHCWQIAQIFILVTYLYLLVINYVLECYDFYMYVHTYVLK